MGPAPASDTPDNRPLHDKLLFLDLPSDLLGRNCKRRVSVERCKPCQNPDDISGIPTYLPSDLTQYVLNSFSAKSLPFHVTLRSRDTHSFAAVVGSSRSYTRPTGPDCSAHLGSGNQTFKTPDDTSSSAGPAPQHNADRRTTSTDKCASAPRSYRDRKVRSSSPPATLSSPATSGSAPSAPPCFPPGHICGRSARDGLWWLGKFANRATSSSSSDNTYIIRFLDDPGPVKIGLQPASYTTCNVANYGYWCFQRHKIGNLACGVLRNSDASRMATTAPPAPL